MLQNNVEVNVISDAERAEGMTREALKQADSGQVISHGEVLAWVESLRKPSVKES
ncbi:Uncharacterised protein [Leminorella richardii]|uniref:CopG family transcriptional regulator n=1 Tax=Leminorella richardii TaxID=158841 RepID=A0A2X4XVH5_9GAMM|nr:hypothetical protein [Leminorella richardii]SQI44075.1 Uncharacterised protein [Leminorella richardii]